LTPETRKLVTDALGRMTTPERTWLTGPQTKIAVSELGQVPLESKATQEMLAYGSHAKTSRFNPNRAAVRLDPTRSPKEVGPAMVEEELRHAYEGMRAIRNPEARRLSIELYNRPEMGNVIAGYKAEGRSPESILREIAANAHRGTLSGPGQPGVNYYDVLYQEALQSPKIRDLYVELLGKIRPPGLQPAQ
jgi:hypothetical protein